MIYDTAYSNDYKSKCSLLLAHRIALWDVLKCADRTGSSDSNIKNQVPNDIPGLLSNYPNIKFILFNGNFSLTCFKKYFGEPVLPYSLLLSTSPALAGRDKERFEMWKKAVSTGRVLSWLPFPSTAPYLRGRLYKNLINHSYFNASIGSSSDAFQAG